MHMLRLTHGFYSGACLALELFFISALVNVRMFVKTE